MNQHDDIDDARATLIDQRISQAFDFLADVIDDPDVLETIPDGATLAFRDVAIRRYRFRLTAYRPPGSGEGWMARVTGYTRSGSRNGAKARPVENGPHPPHGIGVPDIQTRETAMAALDALEAALRDLVRIPA